VLLKEDPAHTNRAGKRGSPGVSRGIPHFRSTAMSKKIDLESLRRLLPDLSRFGCTSYQPGHNVHWIQALHSANKAEVAAQTWSGQIVTVEGELLTVRKADKTLIRFRNHDPARLVVILEHMGVDITVNDQFKIARAGITPAGSFGFSVQPDSGEPLGPCPTGEHFDAAEELLAAGIRTHRGFTARLRPRARTCGDLC
jgi:hypothetical protein